MTFKKTQVWVATQLQYCMINLDFNWGVPPQLLEWNIFNTDVTDKNVFVFAQLRMDTIVLEKKLCALLVQLGKAHFSVEIVVELVLV